MKLIFYTFYRWSWIFYTSAPHLTAMYFLSLCVSLNIVSIINYIKVAFGYSPRITEHMAAYLLLLGIIAGLNYLIYVKDKKYIIIDNYFQQKANFNKVKSNIITTVYVVITILLFFSLAFIKK